MNDQEQARIFIAESRAAARLALSGFLRSQQNLNVVGELDNSLDLMAQVKAICPDIMLLDWDLAGQSAPDLVLAVRDLECQPRVIVLALREEVAQGALDAGADALVYKGDGPKRLLTAIRSVLLEGRHAERSDHHDV